MHPIDKLGDPFFWIIVVFAVPGLIHMLWTIRSDASLKAYIVRKRDRNTWKGVK